MTTPSQNLQRIYRPDIDGLRAIAIVSVIAYHAGFPGFPGGFVGVDIFFVISGFLITSLLFNEAAETGRVNLGAFYARRVRRLMPAGLLVVAVTMVLGALFLFPASEEQIALAKTAIAMSYFGSNFYFFNATGGYFDGPSFGLPLLHTWSLAVEEQYYLLWPIVMLLVFRFSGAQKSIGFMRNRTIWILALMFLVSLSISVATTRSHQNFAFYLLPARVWEFAIGGIVGLLSAGFYLRLRRWADPLAIVGLALIVYSVMALDHTMPFPGWIVVLPVFGSSLLIIGMTASEQCLIRRVLSVKPFVFIGLLSYSWYLWHWPLLSIYRMHNLGIQDIEANVVIVFVALALAWLTYILIENPIRVHRPGPFRKVRSTLWIGLGIAIMTALLGHGLREWRKYQKTSEVYRPVISARNDYSSYRTECVLDANKPFEPLPGDKCTYGSDKQHPKILLWGDSHADHVMPTLIEAFPDISIYQLTMSGCPPVAGYELQVPAVSKFCADFNQRVLQNLAVLKKNGLEAVVISARWPSYLWRHVLAVSEPQLKMTGDPDKMLQARNDMQAKFDMTLTILERAGLKVLVLAPNPEMIYPPPMCIGLGKGSFCNVPRSISDELIADPTAALSEVVSRHKNTRLAELADFFCTDQTCAPERAGKIYFLDENHITATAARELAGYLSADLNWLMSKPNEISRVNR